MLPSPSRSLLIPENYIMYVRGKVGSDVPLLAPGGRAILENKYGEILLMFREDFRVWGFPGGIAEIGESAVACILREVKEETGFTLTDYQPFGFSSNPKLETVQYPNGDVIQAFSLLIHGYEWEGKMEQSEESLDLRFFPLDDLPYIHPADQEALSRFIKYKDTGAFQVF